MDAVQQTNNQQVEHQHCNGNDCAHYNARFPWGGSGRCRILTPIPKIMCEAHTAEDINIHNVDYQNDAQQ